jgi:predicted GNAT family acetyltransferase
MGDELLTARCVCGWETTGPADEVVAATQEHGERLHNMAATREQVLATASPAEIRVVDNAQARRYEAVLGDRVAAFSDYRLVGGRIVFIHTETAPEFEGRGIGTQLVRGTLDDVRRRGLRMTVKCPFIAAWLKRHPDYRDLLAASLSRS